MVTIPSHRDIGGGLRLSMLGSDTKQTKLSRRAAELTIKDTSPVVTHNAALVKTEQAGDT